MKERIITCQVIKIMTSGDKVLVRYRETADDPVREISFDYSLAGARLEELKRKYRFKLSRPTMILTYVHGELIRVKFDQAIEFNSKMMQIRIWENEAAGLLADFRVKFDAFIERQQPEAEEKLLVKIYGLPLLLRYWPLALLHVYKNDTNVLKRITVLVKLLKITDRLYPNHGFTPNKFSNPFQMNPLEGVSYEWDEVLLYKSQDAPITHGIWECFSDDSIVRKQLVEAGLTLIEGEDPLIINYLDYLTRRFKYAYFYDVKAMENNLQMGGGGLLSAEFRLQKDEDELKSNISKMYLFRQHSDLLIERRLSLEEINGLIRIIKL